MKLQKKCVVCGKTFFTARSYQVYCSLTCNDKAKNLRKRPAKDDSAPAELNAGDEVEKQCPHCGKIFETRYPNKICCSAKCYIEYIRKRS